MIMMRLWDGVSNYYDGIMGLYGQLLCWDCGIVWLSIIMRLRDCVANYYDAIVWLIIMTGLWDCVGNYHDGIVGLYG